MGDAWQPETIWTGGRPERNPANVGRMLSAYQTCPVCRSDYGLRRLAPDTYLFTYTLCQGERITRRATIWQGAANGWHILYHQGTIVTVEVEDVPPPAP